MAEKKAPVRPMHNFKHKGVVMLVLGILIILNTLYGWFSWGVFIGGVIAIFGLIKILHPCKK